MTAALAPRETVTDLDRPHSGLALSFAEMTLRVAQLDQFYKDVMQEGTDYGVIPGTAKPSLYQPGAQLLDQIFGLTPAFEVAPSSVIDWDRPIPFFHYVVRCRLTSRRSGELVAEAIGSCNSHEDRYRWRNASKVCPKCGIEAIGRSKEEYGGGYFCNKSRGGCGGRFKPNTRESADLDAQSAGKTENADTASLENTILKMAQKRAHVAATLNATGASRIFTQDIEDLPQFQQALRVDVQVSAATSEPEDAPLQTPPAPSRARRTQPSPPEQEHGAAAAPADQGQPQSRAALAKSLGYRMAHARRLGLDPAELDIDALSDEQLAEVLAALTAQIVAFQKLQQADQDVAF